MSRAAWAIKFRPRGEPSGLLNKRTMNKKRAALSLIVSAAGLALCAHAHAQMDMYPGQSVTVNPGAAGTQVLLYPGGRYMRVLPPLNQPGARPYETIHLHMPVHHRKPRVASAAPVAPAASQSPLASGETMTAADASAITPPPAPAKKKPVPTATAQTTAPQRAAPQQTASADDTSVAEMNSSSGGVPFSLDGSTPAPTEAPPPAKKPPAKPAPQQMASTTPPPAQTTQPAQDSIEPTTNEAARHTGLVKRSEIIFEASASDPAPSTLTAIKTLAGNLSAAISAGAQRIQLEAYGGARHDKSSDARRLSLKRALSIRQILIDDGVPASKIDVRAMGGVDDKGNTDRVDVFVRAS